MLERTLLQWAKEQPVEMLKYVWVLRDDAGERERLSAKLLLRSCQTSALLQSIPFIPASSKKQLLATTAAALKADGLVTQAAQLLYQAELFDSLAALLAEELSAKMQASRPSAEEEAQLKKLRTDSAAFLAQWGSQQPEQAQQHGATLDVLLAIAFFLELSTSWRRSREGRVITQMLAALATPPLDSLLPLEMAQVESVQATFRYLRPEAQRAFPKLIEAAMEALHAKYEMLKAYRTEGDNVPAELHKLRLQAEALVAFAGLSLWISAEALGQLQLTSATSQRIASWLADMA